MESSTHGKCRCCLARGYHRDVMKEYYYNGNREVYSDLFLECFNIYLSNNAAISSLICLSCVQRLRDANTFRTMVVDTEHRLLQLIASDQTVFVNVPVGELNIEQSIEIKEELAAEVKEELSDGVNDDHDQLVDEEFSLHMPDLDQDYDEREAKFLMRFKNVKMLPTSRKSLYDYCPGYVNQLDVLQGKLVHSSTIRKLVHTSPKSQYVNTETIYVSEKMAHILNAVTLLECSNIAPFKSKKRSGFPCFYCRSIFDNVDKLREHQTIEHRRVDVKRTLSAYGAEVLVIYADVTDLKCKLCNEKIPNMIELKSHLTKTHKKEMYLDLSDRVIPFKLSDSNIFECQVCGFNFETFGAIERHMNVHYRNYVCKECGTGFITKYRLKVHAKSMHVQGNFPCEVCKKVYSSQQKLKMHQNTVHNSVKRFKCPKCPERFTEYFKRQKHMVQVHGVAPLVYKCNVCDKDFDRRYTLSRHLKRDHLEERDYKCELCAYQCFTNNELRVHMIKHNGERIFQCSVCKKSYARKKTLNEHMRIHNNDRRFVCAVCGQAFVQKCSLKGHIKTHHIQYPLTC